MVVVVAAAAPTRDPARLADLGGAAKMEVSGLGDAVSLGSPLESVDRRLPEAEPATPRGSCGKGYFPLTSRQTASFVLRAKMRPPLRMAVPQHLPSSTLARATSL